MLERIRLKVIGRQAIVTTQRDGKTHESVFSNPNAARRLCVKILDRHGYRGTAGLHDGLGIEIGEAVQVYFKVQHWSGSNEVSDWIHHATFPTKAEAEQVEETLRANYPWIVDTKTEGAIHANNNAASDLQRHRPGIQPGLRRSDPLPAEGLQPVQHRL